MPVVSVVIPTFNRPKDVVAAAMSALGQTYRDLEVVVVVDGGDPETIQALAALEDKRLRVINPQMRLGNAEARNWGVRESAGIWIALLDDDDLWSPEKIAVQIAHAESISEESSIISCNFEAHTDRQIFNWPRRRPLPDEPVCEYLFCRRRSPSVEGVVQTSTLLAPKALFEAVPFDRALPRMVDIDWILRAANAGAILTFPPSRQALSVYRHLDTHSRVSHQARWRWEFDWAQARRQLFTDRAMSAFLLTSCSLAATRCGDRRAYWPLLFAAYREGAPSLSEIAFHTANMALPVETKNQIAAWFERRFARKNADHV